MSDIVEKVARAIATEMMKRKPGDLFGPYVDKAARAAFEVMRVPDDAMMDAAYEAMFMKSVEDKEACYAAFRAGYAAAIDAALSETGER